MEDTVGARVREGCVGRGAGLTVAIDGEGGVDEFGAIVKFGGRGRALQSF